MTNGRYLVTGTLVALFAAAGQSDATAGMITAITSDPQLANSRGITTNGTSLFLTSFSADFSIGRIFSVPIGGGSTTQLYSYTGPGGAASPLSITQAGGTLFWVDPNSGPGTGTEVRRAPVNGSGPQTVIYNAGSPLVEGSGIATNGTALFVADEVRGRVFRMNFDGSGFTQLGNDRYGGFFDEEHLNTIAVSGGVVYIADSGKAGFGDTPPQIVSIPETGGTFTTLFSGTLPGFAPQGIAVGDGRIFLTNGSDILQMPLTGGTPTLFASDPRFGRLGELTYFNHSLYVTDLSSSTGVKVWQVEVSSVPEPATMTSLAIGAVVLAGYARWRGKRSPQD
jgi:hypothetical protein